MTEMIICFHGDIHRINHGLDSRNHKFIVPRMNMDGLRMDDTWMDYAGPLGMNHDFIIRLDKNS